MNAHEIYIVGVGMTPFGRYPEKTHAQLCFEAVQACLDDAGLTSAETVESVCFGSCATGLWGQNNLRGQACLTRVHAESGLSANVPLLNVEAGCATGAVALRAACVEVASGQSELTLAVGVDKTYRPEDPGAIVSLFDGALNQLDPQPWRTLYADAAASVDVPMSAQPGRSVIIDVCGLQAAHLVRRGAVTAAQLAEVAAHNHAHAAANPLAYSRRSLTLEQIAQDRRIAGPLTRSMCAALCDGAAAALVCSRAGLAALPASVQRRAVNVAAMTMVSGAANSLDAPKAIAKAARKAYAQAETAPADLQLAEVHDSTALAQITALQALGLCNPGEGAAWASSDATRLGGSQPVNVSGGLIARGHALAATGLAMAHELVTQLRHEAAERQVPGARVGLLHNAGGLAGFDEAQSVVGVLRIGPQSATSKSS